MGLSAHASLVACALCAACTLEGAVGQDSRPPAVVADVPDRFRERLDLLFVVDSTDDTAALQDQAAALFTDLFSFANLAEDGLDLHVGVVSSDLGSGSAEVPGCTAAGDGGALRRPDDDVDCAGLTDAWLEIRREGTTLTGNIPGLGDTEDVEGVLRRAMACLSRVGTGGCSYPQPLAAAERALATDHPANRGFQRDDGALGVVFLAGEDDCSVSDAGFFDTSGGTAPRFHCFDRGVVCEGDDVGVVLGPKRDCRPASDAQLMPPSRPADTLVPLRPVDALVVAAAVGDTATIDVVAEDGGPALAPACQRDGAALYPAVRLSSVLGGFPHSTVAPMCADGPRAVAIPTGTQLRTAMGHRCLAGKVADIDAETPGRQWDCSVTAVAPDGARTTLSACADVDDHLASPGPCFAIRPGPCSDFPSRLAVYVNWGPGRGAEAPLGMRTEVACLVDD